MENEFWFLVTIILSLMIIAMLYYHSKEKNTYEKNLEIFLQNNNFNSSKRITVKSLVMQSEFLIDDINKQFAIYSSFTIPFQRTNYEFKKFKYRDLIKFEIEEKHDYKISGNQGGVLTGLILFGLPGALLGTAGNKTMTRTNNIEIVHLYVNKLNTRLISINCSYSFGTAKEIIATLTAIKEQKM